MSAEAHRSALQGLLTHRPAMIGDAPSLISYRSSRRAPTVPALQGEAVWRQHDRSGSSRVLYSAALIDNPPALKGEVKSLIPEQASVLAVDDDVRNLTGLQGLLGDMPVQVVTARSGEEALRCLLKQEFAVILLDARMPGMDGFEVARLIRERERTRHTPIIFLTGAYEDTPSMTRGYEAGAVDYIVKPLRPEFLKS